MSTKEKLINRFKTQPKDFAWDELAGVFKAFGFTVDNKGKTSGSRVLFVKGEETHAVHKPHPGNILKRYVLRQAYNFLTEKGYL